MSDKTDALPSVVMQEKSMANTFFPPFIKEIAYQMMDHRALGLSEPELEKWAGHPCPEDLYELRNRFWFEYYAAQAAGVSMLNETIVPMHIPIHVFIDYLFRDHRIYFLLLPPKQYVAKMSEVLDKSLENFMAIQRVSPVGEGGAVNFKLAELQLKIHVILDNRKHGAPVQRMHAKLEEDRNVNVTTSKPLSPDTVDEILDQKLKEIEDKISIGKALVAKEKGKAPDMLVTKSQVLDEPINHGKFKNPLADINSEFAKLDRMVGVKLRGEKG